MNLNELNGYSDTTNVYRKRDRKEDFNPQKDSCSSKKPSLAEVLLARPTNIQQTDEVKAPTGKRGREWKQVDNDSAALKKLNHDVSSIMDVLERRGTKRGLQEAYSFDPVEEEVDDLPIIEEIPEERVSATVKTAQTALALITYNPGEPQRQQFCLACVRGEVDYIKEYIKINPSVLTDLCQGMLFRNSRMNELLLGLNLAIVNNRSSVIRFLLSLHPVKQHVHFENNLVLRVAFFYNRLFVSSKLLQIPAVLNSVEIPFIERYLISAAEKGNIFQFLMLLSIPHIEKALPILGCDPTCNSFLDVITQASAKFPQLQSAWKGFLEADYTLVTEDSQSFMIQRDELIDILKKPHSAAENVDDLPDLTKLNLN